MTDSSQVHIHRLTGCRPTPLAHYLKALGVLRLVSEQADGRARGWWMDESFLLATRLDRVRLETFFLENYSPTPLLTPWNGGSGFYPKDNKTGLEAIAGSSADRFEAYRIALAHAKQIVANLDAKPDKGDAKNSVIRECRRVWRGPAFLWIEAAMALGSDGDPAFPAMLGTGGNDGRLEFATNFMLRLHSMFDLTSDLGLPNPSTSPQLKMALWESPSPALEGGAIGQFLPGAAGGPNGTSGFSGGIGVNPWDYVLMLEGAVLFAAGLARRAQANALPQAAAPFAVRSSGSGYGSAGDSDVGGRGEQWMPLWSQPSTCDELAGLLREGRSQINGKAAARGTDMARAIARMGVARGIHQFERYGYIERNGLSNLAVPLGRFDVRPRPSQRLLDEVAPWVDRLRQVAADKQAPQSLARVHRACELALFNCATRAAGADFLQLLMAMADAEDQMVASPRFSAEKNCAPAPRPSPQWLDVVEQDSHEYRLALALAAQQGSMEPKSTPAPVRLHWLPLAANGHRFAKGESGLAIGPEQAAIGGDLVRAAISVVDRRLLAFQRGASGELMPLKPIRDCYGAGLDDIRAFLDQRTDDGRILGYARALMAIRFHDRSQTPAVKANQLDRHPLGGLALYGICRLAMPVGDLGLPNGKVLVRCNPMLFHRLRAGDVAGAIRTGCRQLSNAGLRPKLQLAIGSQSLGRRLAASLAFGLRFNEWTRLALGLADPHLPASEQLDEQ
ncbi:MAG: type I-U CRISPR-associated protein Csx17 [Planctomycetales bacterium]|nr:type I-U CRISPR-associated protein Csx17 [Planctomycetales bacterium]